LATLSNNNAAAHDVPAAASFLTAALLRARRTPIMSGLCLFNTQPTFRSRA
jgi:hypothetical protein